MPKDTEDRFYMESEWRYGCMEEIWERAQKKWPKIQMEEIWIEAEHIYASYDPEHNMNFLCIAASEKYLSRISFEKSG